LREGLAAASLRHWARNAPLHRPDQCPNRSLLRPGREEISYPLGENGAGKTTLVKLLARLYDPDEGRILLDGHDLRECVAWLDKALSQMEDAPTEP
jgi:ABC transporter